MNRVLCFSVPKHIGVSQSVIKELQSGIEELEEICHNINKYEQERNFPADKDTHSGLRWPDAGRGKPLMEIADGEEYIA